MEEKQAEILLKKNKNDYNLIAADFSRTRDFDKDLKGLTSFLSAGERVLDIGCGNGRLLKLIGNKGLDYTGIDISEQIIKIAQEKYPGQKFQIFDGRHIPFSDGYFDKIFAIRVFHHLPSEKIRLEFLKEIKRTLKPGGLLILTVWSWHSKDLRIKKALLRTFFLRIFIRTKLDFGDAFIPWQNKVERYYHFFNKNELKKLIEKGGLKVRQIYFSPKKGKYLDIVVVAEKQ